MTRSNWPILLIALGLTACGGVATPAPTASGRLPTQAVPLILEPTEILPEPGAGIPTPERVTTALIDQRLNPFADPACALPCYNGLTPGQADLSVALAFFSRLGISPIDMVPGDYETTLDGTGHLGASLIRATNIAEAVSAGYRPPTAEIAMLAGVVDNVQVNWPYYPSYLTLPTVLQQLGAPDIVGIGLQFTSTPPGYVLVLIDIDRQTGFIFAGVTQQGVGQLDVCPNEQTITNMAMGVFSASQTPLAGSDIARATLPLEQSTGITQDVFFTQMSAGGCLSVTADHWPQWQTP